MQMNTLARVSISLAVVSLTACSGGSGSSHRADQAMPNAASQPTSDPAADAALNDLIGPGCAAYAAESPTGPGSIRGMSQAPAATALGNNSLTKSLTAAVSGQMNTEVNLSETLNVGQYTVFAPVDSAFAKLSTKMALSLKKKSGAAELTKILQYHVVAGQLDPKDVVGSQTTVEGSRIKVTRSGRTMKVNEAHVVCGGVRTENATVYLIDEVLKPPAG